MLKMRRMPVKDLADIIKVHVKTLNAWLCHYSLARYVKFKCKLNGKAEYEFVITKASLKALKNYLIKKNYKHLILLEKAFDPENKD